MAHIGAHPQKQTGSQLDRRRPAARTAHGGPNTRAGARRATVRRWRRQTHGMAKSAAHGRRGRARGDAAAAIEALGLATQPRPFAPVSSLARAISAVVSRRPTPSGTRTKSRHFCETAAPIDTPVNIHLTGCHHSCAQHYIGDIGLLGARVPVGEDGDTVEGYSIFVGGGFAEDAAIARELYTNVKAGDAPRVVAPHFARLYRQSRRQG